jgi:uncharacterized protein (DUF362 family)
MKRDPIERREFIKQGAILTGAAALFPAGIGRLFAGAQGAPPDLASVKGNDTFAAALKALEVFGASRVLPKGGRVGILVNAPSWWKLPGSHVNTEVVLAALEACLKTGVKEMLFLQNPAPGFWERSPRSASRPDLVNAPKKFSGNWIDVEVKGGKSLKKARVAKDLLECDAFVDISIAKDHAGTRFSGCLKNVMGACADPTNRFFHAGSGAKGEYDDVDFLSQCIADIGLVRRPTLCVLDATVVLGENGPAGPGKLLEPRRVIVGSDPVAIDAYGASLIGRNAADIAMIGKAAAHGLGRADVTKISVKEAVL